MILDKVKTTIKRYGLVNKGDKIVIGVSGGPDSLALLYLLYGLRKEFKLRLHIAHFDHKLRKDSGKDKRFVEAAALRLELPITTAEVDIKKLPKTGSLEEIARNARLGFLFRVAKESRAARIALGHNLDDQAETVLMRILRGTGLYGLRSILPKRDIAGYRIIRPLIELKRKEIDSYLKRKRLKPRIDSSNQEDIYFRNRIRNNLLPLLEKKYNGNIKGLLANLAESAGYDYDYLCAAARRSIKGAKKRVNLKRLVKLHPAIRRLIVRKLISGLKGNTRRIGFRHIREIEDLILNRPANSIVDLPQNVSVIKKKGRIYFYRR